METRRDAAASTSANTRLAALHTGPAQDSPAASGPMALSEAIAAGYRARRPWWQRFGSALRGRAPDTLRGRWTLEARAAVALACVALLGAGVGGWYYWQARSTAIALPDAQSGYASTSGSTWASGSSSGSGSDPAAALSTGADAPSAGATAGGVPPLSGPSADPLGRSALSLGAVTPDPLSGGGSARDRWAASLPRQGGVLGAVGDPGDPGQPAALPGPLAAQGPSFIVDVEGKVGHPGVVMLPAGSRVFEALKAAGGAASGADVSGLDLARPLVDGEQLRVGLPGAPSPPSGVPAPAAPPGAAGSARGGHKTRPSQPVDLNTATLDQLQSIPGVGPAMAQRILDWRAAHGRFTSVDQLRDVKGIGDRKFAAMKDSVTP